MYLESHFRRFREQIIGHDLTLGHATDSDVPVIYADWTASGRLYAPIEQYMRDIVGPYVANTHTETTLTGTAMTQAYHEAQALIKRHVNAGENDVIIADGAGMTAVVNRLQRMLGLRLPDKWRERIELRESEKPVVFLTHMEHHSNQTTWNECEVTVVLIRATRSGLPDLDHLRELLDEYRDRPVKIGSFTACSNVTGIITPYHEMAAIMHEHGGLCFVDFAASAPYVTMDMHPNDPQQKLDAVMFSPHKFLGGPGSSGILVFNRELYQCRVPDRPGGGTVSWTNPWGEHHFFEDVEIREDGGTPGFLQTIRAALAIKVKEAMGVENMAKREHALTTRLLDGLASIPGVHILEGAQRERLCIVSFYIEGLHHNLVVRLLNDYFGIQTRGGCSCAGTYGHILLGVDENRSHQITAMIDQGDLSDKPGWVRASLHPTSTDEEVDCVIHAIREIMENGDVWAGDYSFNRRTGEYEPASAHSHPVHIEDFEPLADHPQKTGEA